MIVYFKELGTAGPVLAETGANRSHPDGCEVKVLKRSIQRDVSCHVAKMLYVCTAHGEANPPEVKELCWGECVVTARRCSPSAQRASCRLRPPSTPSSRLWPRA